MVWPLPRRYERCRKPWSGTTQCYVPTRLARALSSAGLGEMKMMTLAEVCNTLETCVALAHGLPWEKVGGVVAAIVFAYGLSMSVAFVIYVHRFKAGRSRRRSGVL